MRFRSFLLLAVGTLALLSFAFRQDVRGEEPAADGDEVLEDHECLTCHGFRDNDAGAPYVDGHAFLATAHAAKDVACVACHEAYEQVPHPKDADLLAMQCAECHDDAYEALKTSVHGELAGEPEERKTTEVCVGCHGAHATLPASQRRSPLYPLNVPQTCLKCHRDGDAATQGPAFVGGGDALADLGNEEILRQRYTDDTHGEALLKAGLVTAPTCVSCHGGHEVLRHTDPKARVHPDNVSNDCGTCHVGILEQYRTSIHGQTPRGHADENANHREPATCTDCHKPHGIRRTDGEFKLAIIETCSGCHGDRGNTYRATYHGRITNIGFGEVASCDDCHTAHRILPSDDPASSLHAGAQRQQTCARCHEGATREFTNYLVHANALDKEGFPILYWIRTLMRGLILGTWLIWGIHLVLWLNRAWRDRGRIRAELKPVSGRWYRRWPWTYRAIHLTLVFSFLLLAMTGLPLRFYEADWSKSIFAFFGGPEPVRILHRIGAFATFAYAAAFLVMIVARLVRGERGLFRGPNSLLPRVQDLKDMKENVRYFVKGGEAPKFDRWTYWEKFDFLAEVWGVFVIGFTGLVMWYPNFFTTFLPGEAINIAHIVHSYEALLATTFIFTIHFFNANLRPGKFPVDPLFLTGRISEEELRHERPREYERMRRDGRLVSEALPPPNERLVKRARVMGTLLLSVGVLLLVLMVWAMFRYGIG